MGTDSRVEGFLITVHLCPKCKGSGKAAIAERTEWRCCGQLQEMNVGYVTRRVCFVRAECRGMQAINVHGPCEICDGRRWVWRDQAVSHAILQGEVPDANSA